MNDTWEQFHQAYVKAPAHIKDLIDSDKIAVFTESELSNTTPEQRIIFRNVLADYAVGTCSISEVENCLSSILNNTDLVTAVLLKIQNLINNAETEFIKNSTIPEKQIENANDSTLISDQSKLKDTTETTNPTWQPVGQATPSAQPATYQTSVPPPPYTPPQPSYQPPQAPYVPPQPSYQTKVTPLTPVGAPVGQSYAQPPVTPLPQTAQPYSPPTPSYGQTAPMTPPQRPVTVADIESRMPPLPTNHTPTQASRFNALNDAPIIPPPGTNIQPVRTMEEDVERIHGYAAYRQQYPHLYTDEENAKETVRSLAQDALLQRTPVVETPRFDEPRG
jgi:hypothetical protein